MLHRRPLVVVGLAAALLAGCGGGASSAASSRLRVVTTVSPITNIVANVAGDRAQVTGLIPEGADSHTFEPPPSAAKVMAEADVIFVNGLKLEDPTKELARENLGKGGEVVELGTRTITPAQYLYDFSFPRAAGKPNPHLWTNPPYVRRYAEVVAATLIRRDPGNASVYRANLQRYTARLDELDGAMKTATATLPPARRKLLTYHDAYAYFAAHYSWDVIGAIQVSNFEDPTPREVADLIRQVRDQRVPAVFGSEVFPSPVLAQIGRETGVRYVDALRDDDLPGRPGDLGHSLVGLLRFDYTTMVQSLGGDPSALRAVPPGNTATDNAKYPQ